jgi:hypothetical protein
LYLSRVCPERARRTIAATTLLMALHFLLAHTTVRSAWLSRFLLRDGPSSWSATAGGPSPSCGRQVSKRVADTRHIILEPSGKITVLKVGTGVPSASEPLRQCSRV